MVEFLAKWLNLCLSTVNPQPQFIFSSALPNGLFYFAGRFKHASRDASSKAGTGSSGGGSGAKELVIEHRIPPRLEMLMDMPPVSKDIQIKHAWNSDDR